MVVKGDKMGPSATLSVKPIATPPVSDGQRRHSNNDLVNVSIPQPAFVAMEIKLIINTRSAASGARTVHSGRPRPARGGSATIG
jgi:hypothetical protein